MNEKKLAIVKVRTTRENDFEDIVKALEVAKFYVVKTSKIDFDKSTSEWFCFFGVIKQ